MRHVLNLCILLFVFIVLLFAAPTVYAGYGCPRYDAELVSSAVSSLALQDGKVVFQHGLSQLSTYDHESEGCPEDLPKIVLTQEKFLMLRPEYRRDLERGESVPTDFGQVPASCKQVGPHVFFGLSFYGGEGMSGVGGIGRFDTQTRELELRHPQALRAQSVYELLVVDQALWLVTTFFGEGPTYGGSLARYEWEKGQFETFDGAKGPCGFDIKDVLVHERELWVATELGISRYSLEHGSWRHFMPADKESQALREITCREIYQDLAPRLSNEPDPSDDACDRCGGTPHGILRALLEHDRPEDARAIRWKESPSSSSPETVKGAATQD